MSQSPTVRSPSHRTSFDALDDESRALNSAAGRNQTQARHRGTGGGSGDAGDSHSAKEDWTFLPRQRRSSVSRVRRVNLVLYCLLATIILTLTWSMLGTIMETLGPSASKSSHQMLAHSSTSVPQTTLVSLIIITEDRSEYVQQALKYISRQSYRNLEVIIYDAAEEPLDATIWASFPFNVTHWHDPKNIAIGARRNAANSKASGSIIMHWDDDDYYGPERVMEQISPLLKEEADITVYENMLHYYVVGKRADGVIDKDVFRQAQFPCYWGPHFGTLTYWKDVWERTNFALYSLGEDYGFAERSINKGSAMKLLKNDHGSFVYVRHTSNSWNWDRSRYEVLNQPKYDLRIIRSRSYSAVSRPQWFSDEDRTFYLRMAEVHMKDLQKQRRTPAQFVEDPHIKHDTPGLLPCFHPTNKKEIPHSLACCGAHYSMNESLGIDLPDHLLPATKEKYGPYLVIGMMMPIYDSSGAAARLLAFMLALSKLGVSVDFIPLTHDARARDYHTKLLQDHGIGIYTNEDLPLLIQGKRYEAAFFHQFYWGRTIPPVARHFDSFKLLAPATALVVISDDLNSGRLKSEATVTSNKDYAEDAMRFTMDEYGSFKAADVVVAITEQDRKKIGTFAELEENDVYLLPYSTMDLGPDPGATLKSWSERTGLVFLGAATKTNVESLKWFVDEVYFYIQMQIPTVTLDIVGDILQPQQGAISAKDAERIESLHGVRYRGPLRDVASVFGKARVFVSPRIISSGVSTKNILAMQYGLPLVTTPQGAEGFAKWKGIPISASEPQHFAAKVVAVHENQLLWEKLSALGPQYVQKFFSVNSSLSAVERLCAAATKHHRKRRKNVMAGRLPRHRQAQELE